ncbi:hypothetical protein NUACC26_031580 [Scytonema sp. NUACC26]
MMLLIQCLEWWWRDAARQPLRERQDFYACGNLTIYYSPRQRKSEQFRGPDFFVVLGTERKPRTSWVVWEEEGKYPNVIVEQNKSDNEQNKSDKKLNAWHRSYEKWASTRQYFNSNPRVV